MVRKIFILRHGEAESGKKWSDKDRPLTNQGKKHIHDVAMNLSGKGIKFDLILCSTSRRTRETAGLFVKPFDEKPQVVYSDELYNATFDQIKDLLLKLDPDKNSVALIGHNPSVSVLATYLLDIQFISLSPGQLVAFNLSIDGWNELYKGCGTIIEG